MADNFPSVTFTMGTGKNEKEYTVIPETVPWADKSYLRHNQIAEFNKAHWKYCCLKTGEIAFIKYRTDIEFNWLKN